MQRLEGLRLEAAALPQGGFVIGHGHVSAADPGRRITAAEARALLLFDLSRLAAEIEPLVRAPVSGPQFDALLSFAFSVGAHGFARSAVLRRLNAGAALAAAAAMELWRCARIAGDPQVIDVLVRRRAAEKARFLEPPAGFEATPSALLKPEEDAAALALAEALDDGRRVRRLDGGADEPAPSAALAAVAALSARLDRLMRTEPAAGRAPLRESPVSEPEPFPEPDPSPEPEREPELASEAEPEPPPVVAVPQIVPAARPAAVIPPEPQTAASPSEPSSIPVEPAPTMVRKAPLRASPGPGPAEPRVSPPSLRAPAFVLGVLGLVVFAFAVLKTYQTPSLAWLGLGLLGIAAMTPASLHLIGPRRRDED